MNYFSSFSGIGAFETALKNIGIDYDIVGYSEIDKFCISVYTALHGDVKNYGDISKIDISKMPNFDLFTYGFPCQDISLLGSKLGLKGSKSSLLKYAIDIINTKLPKIAIMENVSNLLNKKNIIDFNSYLTILDDNYNNYYKILNSKDYGLPQNRPRVYMVSIRKDIAYNFTFPEISSSNLNINDFIIKDSILDNRKNISYLLSDRYKNYIHTSDSINEFIFLKEERTEEAKILRRQGIEKMRNKQFINRDDYVANCILTKAGRESYILYTYKDNDFRNYFEQYVRKLNSLEAWRLQGFYDIDYNTAYNSLLKLNNKKAKIDTQLYKMAGNTISVNVLEAIFNQLRPILI